MTLCSLLYYLREGSTDERIYQREDHVRAVGMLANNLPFVEAYHLLQSPIVQHSHHLPTSSLCICTPDNTSRKIGNQST